MNNEDVLYEMVVLGEWEIDDVGRIWKMKNGSHARAERRTPQGYLQVRKMVNGIRLHAGAHRLVWRHFNGPIPAGMTINHLNGIKDDNRPENLELATYSENLKHAFRTGLKTQWGQSNPAAKLSNKDTEEIRALYAAGGITQAQLGNRFGVTFQTISDIVRGKRHQRQNGAIADYSERRMRVNAKRDNKGRFIS